MAAMQAKAPAPDYWLGERSEYVVTDFDGQLRACWVKARVDWPASAQLPDGRRYLLLDVDPPFQTAPPMPPLPGTPAEQVVISERHAGTHLDTLVRGYLSVYLFTVSDPGAFTDGRPDEAGLDMVAWADVARTPAQLPKSMEEKFEDGFNRLARFAEREGHTDVPADHIDEDGVRISGWLGTMRYLHMHGDLSGEVIQRFEALPSWRWLPGDDLFLIDRYARREGHTDIPPDHEEGRPVGLVVRLQRENHARGGNWALDPERVRRLEAIPHWH